MTGSQRARAAAHLSWALTADRASRTAPARTGLLAKFERQARANLGPEASDRQVADAAESLRKAHYIKMAAAAADARRRGAA